MADDQLIQRCRDGVDLIEQTYFLTRRKLADRNLAHANEILDEFDTFLDKAQASFEDGDPEDAEKWLMAAKTAVRRLLGIKDQAEQARIQEFLDAAKEITDWTMAGLEEALRQVSLEEATRHRLKRLPEPIERALDPPKRDRMDTVTKYAILVAIVAVLIAVAAILKP